MAIQEGYSGFTGSMGVISAYRMRGYDKIIMRGKGGASKRKIKTSPDFETTRNLNSEWKAVTRASAEIRIGSLFPQTTGRLQHFRAGQCDREKNSDRRYGSSEGKKIHPFFPSAGFPQQFPVQPENPF